MRMIELHLFGTSSVVYVNPQEVDYVRPSRAWPLSKSPNGSYLTFNGGHSICVEEHPKKVAEEITKAFFDYEK